MITTSYSGCTKIRQRRQGTTATRSQTSATCRSWSDFDPHHKWQCATKHLRCIPFSTLWNTISMVPHSSPTWHRWVSQTHGAPFWITHLYVRCAKLLDSDGTYFSNRILWVVMFCDVLIQHAKKPIWTMYCFLMFSFNVEWLFFLRALFPCGDEMVCIIDDREDVWNHMLSI